MRHKASAASGFSFRRDGELALSGWTGLRGAIHVPVPRQQRREFVAFGLPGYDPFEHVGEPGQGVDTVQLCGLHQGGDDRPMLSAAVGTREQSILASQRDRSHRTLDGVGVEFDAAIVEERARRGVSVLRTSAHDRGLCRIRDLGQSASLHRRRRSSSALTRRVHRHPFVKPGSTTQTHEKSPQSIIQNCWSKGSMARGFGRLKRCGLGRISGWAFVAWNAQSFVP